jgi:DNA-binding NtrC family response regulator
MVEAVSVLVVDDEVSYREILQRWLGSWGFSVSTAANATDALHSMWKQPAQIVLVDIKMPGNDGFWLIEQLQAKWPRTAIIMATAAYDLGVVEKSKRAGAVDYVLKPFGRELLRQALDRAATVVSTVAPPV